MKINLGDLSFPLVNLCCFVKPETYGYGKDNVITFKKDSGTPSLLDILFHIF